jgi:CDP-2,3-bis-(O-geranylgeranyl)-sn-glycerol synthase
MTGDQYILDTPLVMLRSIQLIYLMLPVYFANMAPPFVKYWTGWNRPISRRWLGDHKTVVGFILGVGVATLTTYVQSLIAWGGSVADNQRWLVLGLACGFGALGGDALKSLIKRRIHIAPGKLWIPADQLDFVLGGLVALSFFVALRPVDVALILAVSFLGDIVINHLSFRLGVRNTRW